MLVVACSGGGASAPTPTASPQPTATAQPTATPIGPGSAQPELERVLAHIDVLSEEIGIRGAGSPQADETVAYAREQFEAWGYQVGLQDFEAVGPDVLRYATLAVEQPAHRELRAVAFGGSASGEVSGPLIDTGTGTEEDFPAEAGGFVLLIQRLDVPFLEMARRALDAGAAAVIVSNKEPGLFPGLLEPAQDLPMIAIDQADGDALRDLLSAGQVGVSLNIRARVTAQNVVARPASGRCRTLSVGHHDSVPWSRGANDNASGAALVLELARATAAAELPDHCFVLFGAEELGLVGSAFFVSALSEGERSDLEAVFNYDAAAAPGGPQLIGATALAEQAQAVAERIGVEAEIAMLPETATSDHASFLEGGIAALMLTGSGADAIHTPEETLANLIPDSLEPIAALGFALLREFSQDS